MGTGVDVEHQTLGGISRKCLFLLDVFSLPSSPLSQLKALSASQLCVVLVSVVTSLRSGNCLSLLQIGHDTGKGINLG